MNFFTLKFEDNKLILLDQTKLPLKEEYLSLDDFRQVVEAIKMLRVRGAPAIGIAAAYASVLACNQAENTEQLLKYLDEIREARPTAVNLMWAVDQIKQIVEENINEKPSDLSALIYKKAEEIHESDRKMCELIGENGSALIKDGMGILTHCNAGALATGGIGTALAVIYYAAKQGKNIAVYADETRPLLQGARLTTWELQQENIKVILNTDNMAGSLMQAGKIDCVITGADRVTRNYDVINKIGTYGVAVLANYHKVPFYVAIPMSTYDPDTPEGEAVEIEEREPSEIVNWGGIRIAPENTEVYSPAFDITPHELVSAIITDTGIIYPNK